MRGRALQAARPATRVRNRHDARRCAPLRADQGFGELRRGVGVPCDDQDLRCALLCVEARHQRFDDVGCRMPVFRHDVQLVLPAGYARRVGARLILIHCVLERFGCQRARCKLGAGVECSRAKRPVPSSGGALRPVLLPRVVSPGCVAMPRYNRRVEDADGHEAAKQFGPSRQELCREDSDSA